MSTGKNAEKGNTGFLGGNQKGANRESETPKLAELPM